jgi:hypothetical protein
LLGRLQIQELDWEVRLIFDTAKLLRATVLRSYKSIFSDGDNLVAVATLNSNFDFDFEKPLKVKYPFATQRTLYYLFHELPPISSPVTSHTCKKLQHKQKRSPHNKGNLLNFNSFKHIFARVRGIALI